MTEALNSGQPAPVQVLPLEWHIVEGALPPETIKSQGELHVMSAYPNEKGSWTLDDGMAVSEHDTAEDVKEAGRLELERRILAHVKATPALNAVLDALRSVVEAAHHEAGEVDRRLALLDARNAIAAWDKKKPVQAGSLDQGVPNHHDHTQRGFSPR